MLNGCSSKPVAEASVMTCPTISPAVRCRTSPILPVRQKPQDMAQPTWVDTQKVMAGVSGMNTDSIRRPSLELEDELPGAVGRELIADDLRAPDGESRLQLAAKLL